MINTWWTHDIKVHKDMLLSPVLDAATRRRAGVRLLTASVSRLFVIWPIGALWLQGPTAASECPQTKPLHILKAGKIYRDQEQNHEFKGFRGVITNNHTLNSWYSFEKLSVNVLLFNQRTLPFLRYSALPPLLTNFWASKVSTPPHFPNVFFYTCTTQKPATIPSLLENI